LTLPDDNCGYANEIGAGRLAKLPYLALRHTEKDWKMPQRTWKVAANQFAILFGERFTNAID
jgi:hypothetical protein